MFNQVFNHKNNFVACGDQSYFFHLRTFINVKQVIIYNVIRLTDKIFFEENINYYKDRRKRIFTSLLFAC